MVTYCEKCGSSLPFADVLIKDGNEITAPGYKCPDCGFVVPDPDDADLSEIDSSKKIVISNGEEKTVDLDEDSS